MSDWYEFLMPGVATTHIACVYEDGSVYLPEGPQVVSEIDFLGASAEGRAHRLVREEDIAQARAETWDEAIRWARYNRDNINRDSLDSTFNPYRTRQDAEVDEP